MPQMSTDCLGLLHFLPRCRWRRLMDSGFALAAAYAQTEGPVAFVDETYQTNSASSFYAVAVAVIARDALDETRAELTDFYGGEPLHAAPMWQRGEVETLRLATHLVARQHDLLDVVVCAPIEDSRDTARARCLRFAASKVHREIGVSLFVIDGLGTPTENRLDQHTFSDLRSAGDRSLSRNTRAVHCRPSDEALLGLPDVLAWSYRQQYVRNDPSWFEPLRELTEVTFL